MTRRSSRSPDVTTFRRKVRTFFMSASQQIPLELVQASLRRDLNGRKHTVIENSWRDEPRSYYGPPDHRTVFVRYVTGGMRHGLGPSTEMAPGVGEVAFTRAHQKEPVL